MSKTVIFGNPSNPHKIALAPNGNNYYQSIVPGIPSLVEWDGSNLWLSSDQQPELCLKLIRSQLILCPKQGWVVGSAPIQIALSHLNINEELRKLCNLAELQWSIRSWGLEQKGKAKNQPFTSPELFTILPEEIQENQGIKESLNHFGGYLDFDVTYQIQGGYVFQYVRKVISILSTQEFFETIIKNIWSFVKTTENILLKNLVHLFHSYLEREVPFDTFLGAIKGNEISRQILVYTYEYSPVVSGDGNLEFSINPKNSDRLMNETCKMIIDQVHVGFSADENFPKISLEALTFNLENRVRQLVEPSFLINGQNGGQRIVPGKMFFKIDPRWKSLI